MTLVYSWIFIFNKTIKKKMSTHTIVWVKKKKKIKSYATIVLLSIFSLGNGRKLLCLKSVKNLKSLQSALSGHNPP